MDISSFFDRKSTLFIETDKKYLKLSQSVIKGQVVSLEKLVVEPVFNLSEEEISKVLADVLNLNKIIVSSISVIIPRERVITRYIKLPSIDKAEIESMVAFEISKQTPYAAEDIISDYKITGVDEQGYSRVMMVFLPKAEITRVHTILDGFISRLKNVYFSSEAVTGWLGVPRVDIKVDDYACIINIDTDKTEIVIVSGRRLCFSRSISIGSDDLSAEQPAAGLSQSRLLDEIRQSIAMYLKEKDAETGDIAKLVVTGAIIACESFLDFLKANIDTPSIFINSLSGIQMSDNALNESGIPDNVSACAICGGPFVEAGINLLPKEQKALNRKKQLLKKTAAVTTLLIILVSFLLGAGLFKINQRKDTLKRLELIYSQVGRTSSQLEEKLNKVRSVREYLAGGESSLDVIYSLYEIIPPGISLLDFDYDDISKSVRFSGRAGRMSDVFNLVLLLENSDIFSNVQTRSVAQRQSAEGPVVDFQIRCNFNI